MTERVLSVRLRAVVGEYEAAMGRAATATEKVAKTGKQMEQVGKKMTLGFSAPMVAAGGFALKSATNFESAFAGVRKTVDGTERQMASLRQGIIDMANTDVSSTREEIAGVAEAAGQLGIQTQNVLSFSRTMIDLGNSTDVVAQEAAMSLAQLANITKMPQSEFGNLGSSIVALGNNMATTESRIIDMSQRMASAGSQVGLSEAQIVGFAAAVSQTGIDAEAGGTAISKVMIEVAKSVSAGGTELAKWSQIAGMSSDQFASLFKSDAAAAMTQVVVGLGKVSESGQDLFGVMEDLGMTDIRVGNMMRSLAGNSGQLTRALKLSTDAWDKNTALSTEAGMRYATTESRMKMTANRVTDVARQFGEVLFPAVNAALNVISPLATGMSGLVGVMAAMPEPLKVIGGAIMGVAVATGPAIWGLGKLASLYSPLVSGAMAVTGQFRYMAGALESIAATRGITTMAAAGEALKASFAGMVGPMLGVVAGVAAIGAAMYLAKRHSDNFAKSHMTAAQMSDELTTSLGLQRGELRKLNDEKERGNAISDEQFVQDNKNNVSTISNLPSEQAKADRIIQIGYQMRLEGQSPEDVMEGIERLAKVAGVTLPVDLEIADVDNFDRQVKAAIMSAREIGQRIPVSMQADIPQDQLKPELDNIAKQIANAYNVGNVEGFARLLGETTIELGDNSGAVNHLVDQFLKLSDVQGVNTGRAHDFVSALEDLAKNKNVPAETRKRVQGWLDETDGMSSAARAAAILGSASTDASWSMDKYQAAGEEANKTTDATTDGQKDAAGASKIFAAALDKVAANASLARIDFDAGAAAAQAFAEALEMTSRTGARMSAGLQGGAALKSLREGMTGSKQIADITARASKENDKAAKSIDRLGDVATRAEPRVAMLQARLDALAAAGEAFSKSIDNSSMLDDQVSSALSLGDAYKEFAKTYRRLPADLDMVAMATGKLRPRQVDAINNMLGLGKAAKEYLATLIEMGSSDADVLAQAARMRGEYQRMFTQMGMTTEQANKYVEAMGLMPSQVETAVKLSGVAAAQAQLSAYLDLLDGRIPAEVATSMIAQIESGDVEGAAKRLADYARSNPALISVELDRKSVDDTQSQIAEVRSKLWELPKDFDPLKAMLGEYTDAQQSALDGAMQFGDAVSAYLSQVAHDGNANEIRDQAHQIRDAFLDQIGQTKEQAQSLLDMIGLSDWQIETAISVSGDAEAILRIQTYSQLLGDTIPEYVKTDVLTLMDEGKLKEAADRYQLFRETEQNKPFYVKAQWAPGTLGDTLFGPLRDAYMQAQIPWGKALGIAGHAEGGLITGPGTGTSDSIVRRVSNGEYVLKAAATSKIGPTVLDQMNRTGTIPGTAVPYGSQPLAPVMPDRLSLDDASISKLAQHLGGRTVNLGGVSVVAPSPKKVPRLLAESVGSEMFLGGL